MKVKIYRSIKRVPISQNIVNLTDEAKRWQELEKKLRKRVYNI